jgi:hypothetical protein
MQHRDLLAVAKHSRMQSTTLCYVSLLCTLSRPAFHVATYDVRASQVDESFFHNLRRYMDMLVSDGSIDAA